MTKPTTATTSFENADVFNALPVVKMEEILATYPIVEIEKLEKFRKKLPDSPDELLQFFVRNCTLEFPNQFRLEFDRPLAVADIEGGSLIVTLTDIKKWDNTVWRQAKLYLRGMVTPSNALKMITRPSFESPAEAKLYDSRANWYSSYIAENVGTVTQKLVEDLSKNGNREWLALGMKPQMFCGNVGERYSDEDTNNMILKIMPKKNWQEALMKGLAAQKEPTRWQDVRGAQNAESVLSWAMRYVGNEVRKQVAKQFRARIGVETSKLLSSLKKKLVEDKSVRQELAGAHAIKKTQEAVATLTELQKLKSSIDTVVLGITKNTLSSKSIDAFDSEMRSVRDRLRFITRDLRKYYVRKAPAYLKIDE